MVSPSKIFKTSSSGYNVSIISSKKDGLKVNRASKLQSSSQVVQSQLLANTRFYLDIRNRNQLDEVKVILKSHGAKIELFFRKDIKVIVTDKAEWMGSGLSSNSSISPLTTPSPSVYQDQRSSVPKSRASAMLEKVSQQPPSFFNSPLELAQKWRIPVLTVRSLRKWIAKVEEDYTIELNEKKKENKPENKIVVYARHKAPFIKVESTISPNTPEFLELEAWPNLNLEGHLGQCPFRFPSPPSPSLSDHAQEVGNNLFDVKDKVSVELIQYNTDFRIKDNIKLEKCEEVGGEEIEVIENRNKIQFCLHKNLSKQNIIILSSKMTRRPTKNNSISHEDEASKITDSKLTLSPLCNGHTGRSITRQSSQELLKVQCNGLATSHRNSKLLSPSGSDVLPLPTSRRSTRRASASWCGSTRELSQLSPTDSEIENIRRSDCSFEAHDAVLDSPGITLRPKGQLWLPIALIGTTAEENGNCIRKRYDYSIKQTENLKVSSDLLDFSEEKSNEEYETFRVMPRVSKESDLNVNPNPSIDYQVRRNSDKRDAYCIVTRNTKGKGGEINGSRESSIESHKSDQDQPKKRIECKKRSLSVCGSSLPSAKRMRTLSTNSVHTVGRKKKLSPEEKLLRDNKEYFKMEVLNTKLRSTGSLLNVCQNKELDANEICQAVEKIDKIVIKKIRVRGKRKKSRWTKASSKKPNEAKLNTLEIDNKKSNKVKINGVIRKKRQSELMKLCNEAESFMFGESSRHGHAAISIFENESQELLRKKSISLSSYKLNAFGEVSKNSSCENEGKTRKKRRSHAEAFIHDNLDYYKFETPESRLRYQGSFLDIKSEDKDFIYTLKHKKKDVNKKKDNLDKVGVHVDVKEEKADNQEKKRNAIIPSEEVEKILFSFESIPTTEPWYEVYKRQDEGLENYYPLLSDPNDQPFLLPYELPKPVYSKVPTVNEYYRRRRKKLVHLFNHPRKSPRCHASTLAILSSLKKRKRRSGTNISMNNTLCESVTNSLNVSDERYDANLPESEKKDVPNEEILNFLYEEFGTEDDEILLEPFSDSECKADRKNSDSCKSVKSDEDESKNNKTSNRGKKLTKADSACESEATIEDCKYFSWQTLKPSDCFSDVIIETHKKSGLIVNVTTILEDFRNCTSMEDTEDNFFSQLNQGCVIGTPEKCVRQKRKKARKINKTGWDNRKSRRRTGNKISEVKTMPLREIEAKQNRVKAKLKIRENGISSENIINGSKRCSNKRGKKNSECDNRPLLRSQLGAASLRRPSQDKDIKSDGIDSTCQEYASCVVRMRKLNDTVAAPGVRHRCSAGRYALQKRRLVLNRKKKRVIDYAWSSKKR